MIKKILISIALLVIVYCFYDPLVFWIKDPVFPAKLSLQKGQIFTLREILNPKSGVLKAYVIVKEEDRGRLSRQIRDRKILKTTDQFVINDLLDLKFKYKDADVATLESKMVIYLDNEIVFAGSISLDSTAMGIQNSYLGWVSSEDNVKFSKVLGRFNNYYIPVLIIN